MVRSVEAVPLVFMRHALPNPGRTITINFGRTCSRRPIEASALYGRRAFLARQRDDRVANPSPDDVRSAGLLVEFGRIEKHDQHLAVDVHARKLARIVRVSHVYDDGVAEAEVAYDDKITEAEIGGFEEGGVPAPLATTPHELLREYIATNLKNDLAALPERAQTELTLQFHVHAAIERWLEGNGTRIHHVVKQNAATGTKGEFSDLLVVHPSGNVAFEIKKHDHAEDLIADMRKLKGYLRCGAAKTGVLVFSGRRGVPAELLRGFAFDSNLLMLYLEH